MNVIGIKLADGSFYPILEEGVVKKRILDLTTVKDNQTTVKIDIFRSETGSMQNAEYVDTLVVEKLKPHPNGELDLHLCVGLDEEGKLSAEIIDDETGKKSEVSCKLLSKTLSEAADGENSKIEGVAISDTVEPQEVSDAISLEDDFATDSASSHAMAQTFDDGTFFKNEDSLTEEIAPNSAPNPNDETILNEESAQNSSEENPLSENFGEDFATDDATDFSEDFSVPDFDESASEDSAQTNQIDEFDNFFDDLDEIDNDFENQSLQQEESENNFSAEQQNPQEKTSQAQNPMDFSDLYDDETLSPKSEEETVRRKTRKPVIICIICAIICVLATILILFVVPSKYNLLKSRNTKFKNADYVEVSPEEERAVAEIEKLMARWAEEESEEEQPSEEDSAQEEERLANEKAEAERKSKEAEIVPKIPEKPVKSEANSVTHKIKWGDTLWDISDSYYKNPWKYKKIAAYNKIKNPDLIISGTTIEIPAE